MKEKLTAAGSALAAVLASSCCWGPLLLAGLGAGDVGFASALAPYRPCFIGVTLLFLAAAWYFTLRKRPATASACPTETSAAGGSCGARHAQEACCAPNGARRRNILLLSGVTAFALVMLTFPELSTVLAACHGAAPALKRRAGPVEAKTLAIRGMTCEACEGHVRAALLKVPGVVAAQVGARTGSARVTSRQGRVSPEQLKQVVAMTGYTVSAAAATTLPARVPGDACCAPGAGK
jgi:copper chaperone CopZ